MDNNDILLIDGSSFVFRAFHAIPSLNAPDGKPTNATYGVINMLKQMQKKYITTRWACVFDLPGKTFRDEIHPEYKATRAPTPTDLICQLEDIYTIVKALGIPVIMQSGVEADDIIGTIAIKAKNAGKKVYIATGDKDFAQLVDKDITLVNTMTNEVLDIAGVVNKFGVQPEQIIDYLSLIGDKVDNVPGVDKCGPKTAVKWLSEYITIENLVTNADKIGGVVGENLRRAIPWLPTAKKLITIDTHVILELFDIHNVDEFICQTPNHELLREYYTKLGFRTWLKQIESGDLEEKSISTVLPVLDTNSHKSQNVSNYISKPIINIESVTGLKKIVEDLIQQNKTIALLALANNYEQPSALKIVTLATAEQVYIIHNENIETTTDLFAEPAKDGKDYMALLKHLFSSHIAKIIPNAKETLQLFTMLGLELNNIYGDLTLAHYIRNSKQKHTMSNIFNEYLNLEIVDLPTQHGKLLKDSLWLSDDLEKQTHNCYTIINHCLELEANIRNELSTRELELYLEVELPLARILVEIEYTGIMLDKAKFSILDQELRTKLAALEEKIYADAGVVFNINSTKQLQDVLFNQLQLPTQGIKKNSNGFSTDEDTLNILAEQGISIAIYMLEYRTLSKLLNTYVSKLPLLMDNKDRVHTTFDQALVASGRLSSRDPNLQNIPVKNDWGRRIRQCFIAAPGHQLICADYSQIELRILAVLSGDENLINAFNTNQDIHSITASDIFHKPIDQVTKDERRYAKTINFSLIYGKTVFGLAQELSIDRVTAKLYIDTYFAKYPKIKQCLENIKDFARLHGYVETFFGRRVYLPNINTSNKMVREAEERLALNAPMQGTSADIIKKAMLHIDHWLKENKLKTKMVLQVHDELIFEVPTSEINIIQQNLSSLMTNAVNLAVQMAVEVKIAANWDEAH